MAENKKYGIIGAMEVEVATLKERAEIRSTTDLASMSFCEGTLDGTEVVIVKCGMGKVNAGICAQILITRFGVTHIINTGVAGSLNADIDIGDLVVSTDAVQHDFDVSPLGFKKGLIPYTGQVSFPADERLRRLAVRAARTAAQGAKVFEGRVCSGDQFIADRETKERITGRFGGCCTEMEGAAIAQVCWLNNIPFVIIRAISDKADTGEQIPYVIFERISAERCAAVTAYMVTNDTTD